MKGVVSERVAMPSTGAAFYRQDGEVMFRFVIDAGNIIGPRPATKADSEKHPQAWRDFVAGDAPEPVVEVVPDAREPEPSAAPLTVVAEKDMSGFEGRIAPAPEAAPKRKYTRRQVA